MWRKLEALGQRTSRSKIPEEVLINDTLVTDTKCVLDKWKNDFAGLYRGTDEDEDASKYDISFLSHAKNYVTAPSVQTFSNYEYLVKVKVMTESLKNGKAVSVDRIPNEVLRNPGTVKMLCSLYNVCLENSSIPEERCRAIITPIFKGKGKDAKQPLSYRPVSLI